MDGPTTPLPSGAATRGSLSCREQLPLPFLRKATAMSALPLDLLLPACIIIASAARVLTELIRARTTRQALREALRDTRPEDRPAIVIALAQLVHDGRQTRSKDPTDAAITSWMRSHGLQPQATGHPARRPVHERAVVVLCGRCACQSAVMEMAG